MTIPIQLTASVAKGGSAAPTLSQPDGSQSAFVIPTGRMFVITDISIQRLSVLGTPELVVVGLEQNFQTGTTLRWSFVGQTTTNVERNFTTGIAFTAPFVVTNDSQSADAAVVRLWGYFQ